MSQTEFYRGLTRAQSALRACGDLPPARAASAVHRALTPLLAPQPDAPERACAPGCCHCCHFPVGVTFAEAALLARRLSEDAPRRGRFLDAVRATADADWNALVGRPCPLLDGGACAVYADRPLPCRSLASRDALACARSLEGRTPAPWDEAAFHRGLGAAAALAAAAPPNQTRELRAAVAAVLGCENPRGAAEAFRAARGPA